MVEVVSELQLQRKNTTGNKSTRKISNIQLEKKKTFISGF